MTMSILNGRNDPLADLRAAIHTGDVEQIRAAIPEPPGFLSVVFTLEAEDRNKILASALAVLDIDEDRWEIIEAAAMNTIAWPERNALLSVVPYIPRDLFIDVYRLIEHLPESDAIRAVRRALDEGTDLSSQSSV